MTREAQILSLSRKINYIAYTISKTLPDSVLLDDLVSCGTMGAIEAVDKFDNNKGVSLKTFSEKFIRGRILDYLRNEDYIPRLVREHLKREAKDQEKQKIPKYLQYDNVEKNLKPLYLDSPDWRLLDLSSKDFWARHTVDKIDVEKLLKDVYFTKMESLALYFRFYQGLTLSEISKILNIGEARSSQLITQVLLKIRESNNIPITNIVRYRSVDGFKTKSLRKVWLKRMSAAA